MTTYSNDSLARITEFHEFVPVNLSTKLAINRGKQPDKEEKFWKKFSAILVLVRANVGRKSGVKGETGRHARVRMSADDARRHTCARARAMLHTFTELSDRLPGYANSNALLPRSAIARLRRRERTLFPPPPPFLFTTYSHTAWVNRRIEIVARVSVADASSSGEETRTSSEAAV